MAIEVVEADGDGIEVLLLSLTALTAAALQSGGDVAGRSSRVEEGLRCILCRFPQPFKTQASPA